MKKQPPNEEFVEQNKVLLDDFFFSKEFTDFPIEFVNKLEVLPSKGVSFFLSSLNVFTNELKINKSDCVVDSLNGFIEDWTDLIGNRFFDDNKESVWEFKVLLLVFFLKNKKIVNEKDFFLINENSFSFLKSPPLGYSNKDFMKEALKFMICFSFDQDERLIELKDKEENAFFTEEKNKSFDWVKNVMSFFMEKTGFSSLEDFLKKEKCPLYIDFNNKFVGDNICSWLYLISKTKEKSVFFDKIKVMPDLSFEDVEGKNLLFYLNEKNLNYLFENKIVSEKEMFHRDKKGNLITNYLTEELKKETYNKKRNRIKEKLKLVSDYVEVNNFKEENVNKSNGISDNVFFEKCEELSSNDSKKLTVLEKNIPDFYNCLNQKQKNYLLWFSFYNCFDSINGIYRQTKKVVKGAYQDANGEWRWLSGGSQGFYSNYQSPDDLRSFNFINKKAFSVFSKLYLSVSKNEVVEGCDNKIKLIQKVFDVIFSSKNFHSPLNSENEKMFFKDEIFKINRRSSSSDDKKQVFDSFFEGFLKNPELFSIKKFQYLFVKMAWFMCCFKNDLKLENFEKTFKEFVTFCEGFDGLKVCDVVLDCFHLGLFSVLWNKDKENIVYQEKTRNIILTYLSLSHIEKKHSEGEKNDLGETLKSWNVKELDSIPEKAISLFIFDIPEYIRGANFSCHHWGVFLNYNENNPSKRTLNEIIFNNNFSPAVTYDENLRELFKVFFVESEGLNDADKVLKNWNVSLLKRVLGLPNNHAVKRTVLLREKFNGVLYNDVLKERLDLIDSLAERSMLLSEVTEIGGKQKKGLRF